MLAGRHGLIVALYGYRAGRQEGKSSKRFGRLKQIEQGEMTSSR